MLQQLGFDFIPPASATEAEHRIARTLPTDEAELIEDARSSLRRYHDSVFAGNFTAADELEKRVDAIAAKMNGGSHFGMAMEGGGQTRLAAAIAAPDGTVPTIGQPGRFLIEIDECWTVVDWVGPIFGICPFSITALCYDRPFFSSTGFRSFSSGTVVAGMTVDQIVARAVRHHRQVDGDGKPRKTPAKLETIEGREWHAGERLKVPLPRGPDLDDPAWQPGGWLRKAAAKQGYKPKAAKRSKVQA
jgi:hypothetical protein